MASPLNTVKIDCSFNEQSFEIDHISLAHEEEFQAYSFTDLVAEKIRSVIQPVERNRSRRQDIYDPNFLMDSDAGREGIPYHPDHPVG